MPESDLIQTGISGLDDLFLGGITRGNLILVEGRAGTGKTAMGLEFIYRGLTQFDEPGVVVVFESSPQRLIRDAAGFGWDFEQAQRQNKLKIIFTSPQVLEQELRSPDSLLLEAASQLGARRIFIDGISLLSPMNGVHNGSPSYRELLHQLVEGLHRENLTAMLAHEVLGATVHPSTLEVAEFLMDTVIVLGLHYMERCTHRSVEILKSRGQAYEGGQHTLRITGGKGLEVFRRVQARARGEMAQPTSTTKRSVIGVDALDSVIGGGIFDGSTTMLVGGSGSGKTVTSVQLLLEGAVKQNRRGLLVSLDEHPAQILRNAETLGLHLQEQVDNGMIHVLFESPNELEIDPHFDRIIRTIEQHKIERLVIDGMSSYSTSLEDFRVYREFFHAVVSYTKHRLMTTFFNYENPEVFGISRFMPDFPLSSIVDNIILLNFVELNNRLHRAMTVVKARGCHHDFITREYEIGQGGIRLKPVDEANGLPMLPFQRYLGVLSRAPTRLSPDIPSRTPEALRGRGPEGR